MLLDGAVFLLDANHDAQRQSGCGEQDMGRQFVAQTGQVGQDSDGKWCYGRSMIVDPWGVVLTTAPDRETIISANIELEQLEKVRKQVPSVANRMPDRYQWAEDAIPVS